MNFFKKRKQISRDKLSGYAKGIQEKNIEIRELKSLHQKEIDRLISGHKSEISRIRADVKNEYEPRLKEKNDEIIRLNKIINDNQKLYEQIKKDEMDAKFKIQEIGDIFLAAFNDHSRAAQKVEMAKTLIKKLGITETKKIEQLEG